MDRTNQVKEVIAVCNDFIDGKILFADRKIQNILTAIAENQDVYNLIGECLSAFNREKEIDKAFTVSPSGKGTFIMPKEEYKVIALTFCLLVDINSGKINFDELIGSFFLDENGKKSYASFMQKVIEPFKNLLAEAFGISNSVTTVEAIEEMKEQGDELLLTEMPEKDTFGKSKYNFKDNENLDRTFDLSRGIAAQINELLDEERKNSDEIVEGKIVLNSIAIACQMKNFDMLIALVYGLKHLLRPVKVVRFLVKELVDVVQSQLYCD